MTLVPTKEQLEHAEDKLRLIGSMNLEHQAELAKLKRVIEKRGLRVVQMHMHYKQQKVQLTMARNRIRELEAENAKLKEDNADVNNSINVWMAHANEAEDRASAAEAKLATREQPQFPAYMLGKPVTTPEMYFNMDMTTAPRGGKLIVLNPGRVATFAVISERNRDDFLGWAPMPKIPKD